MKQQQQMTIFYIISFIIQLLDYVAIEFFIPKNLGLNTTNEELKDVIKSFVAAIIWVSYFNMADRV